MNTTESLTNGFAAAYQAGKSQGEDDGFQRAILFVLEAIDENERESRSQIERRAFQQLHHDVIHDILGEWDDELAERKTDDELHELRCVICDRGTPNASMICDACKDAGHS